MTRRPLSTEDVDPGDCRSLWIAVLLQAFRDAGSTVPPRADAAKARQIRRDREEARNFLLYDEHWFYKVCEFSGFPASSVRRKAEELRAVHFNMGRWQMPHEGV